jgi:predicted DNA-binding transcriptional regulator YafY
MKKETNTHFRIIEMLHYLMSNWATIDELQSKFSLSKRMVMYYLSAYRKTGFTVETKTEINYFYHVKHP